MNLICIETRKKTKIELIKNLPIDDDENIQIIRIAANRLVKREPEHKYDFVCIDMYKRAEIRSEIFHALTNLTEHTGEFCTHKVLHEENTGCQYAHSGCPVCEPYISRKGRRYNDGIYKT